MPLAVKAAAARVAAQRLREHMKFFAAPVEKLIEQFERLPGIGHKSAQRLAFHILSLPRSEAEAFAAALISAKDTVFTCRICHNLTDGEVCPICSNPARDKNTICVVTDPKDVLSIERTREFNGLYHVLHGVISPMNHIGPDDLKIRELLTRVSQNDISEIIMATNPDTEGEATAMYLYRLISPFKIKITRLAYGVPVGAHLEYADEITLARALEGRREI